MYKLFLLIFSILIFENISQPNKNCKYSKNGVKGNKISKFSLHRPKRGLNTKNDCEEEASSSGLKELTENVEKLNLTEKQEKKRGLYICDNYYYSHTKFNELLAHILSEKYEMDVVVYTRSVGGHSVNPKNVNLIINVPIPENKLHQNILENEGIEIAFTKFSHSFKFRIGIYEEIISNKKVKIGEQMVEVFEWLSKQKYSFGIAEFNNMEGPFAVFEALGIENTFDVSASIFYPEHLQFLGIDVKLHSVPEFKFAIPGDWLNDEGLLNKESKRYKENSLVSEITNRNLALTHSRIDLFIFDSFHTEGNVKDLREPSSVDLLFKKVKFHFVNQPFHAKFKEFPSSENIIYIGGILVEQNKILIKEEKVKASEDEPNCVVLLTFGTVNLIGDFDHKSIAKMFEELEKHSHCLFKVRLNKFVPENYNKDIINVTDEILPQKEILSKENTKLFISHCGQNSLTEAIYAGVPLICIPCSGDQFYNSSLVEQLGIGIYIQLNISNENGVDSEVFGADFQNALDKMLIDNNIYQKTANVLRSKILLDLEENGLKKNIFLQKISEVIGN